ncbi:hypothetical protein K2Z83_25645 [Oscillochloris sp. ZM17-4]|uniref:hypothetical protein n=1 Tax=Oscillochloris sp. ZM17-4 TaxID=2866714 RepID=UPI001C72D8E0|nr:hypothetical protein [Oscillochloris sp. ZM17-4]MBX0331041.1 hypothetical protein [Oscillochloris sp. ZM17-4]
MNLDTERALRDAHEEIRRRHQWADQERMARQAAGKRQADHEQDKEPHIGPMDWLRRLAGAR